MFSDNLKFDVTYYLNGYRGVGLFNNLSCLHTIRLTLKKTYQSAKLFQYLLFVHFLDF